MEELNETGRAMSTIAIKPIPQIKNIYYTLGTKGIRFKYGLLLSVT
jgi:hypothetical protein